MERVISVKCPACGCKYKGKKCPDCGRHTDPKLEAQRNTRIALLVLIGICVLIAGFYLLSIHTYYGWLQNMVHRILGS